jgi:hypothetical protein
MIPVLSSRANVNKLRILVWMLINIMLTVSGAISFIAIREPVIMDVAIASMLLETDKTIRTHPQQLGDLSILAEGNQNLRLRLKHDNGHRVLGVIDPSGLPSKEGDPSIH